MKKILLGAVLIMTVSETALASVSLGSNAQVFFTGSAIVRYDDNILQSSGATKISDTIIEIDPGVMLNLGAQGAQFKTTLAYTEAITRYVDTSALNTELSQLSLNSDFSSPKTNLGFNAAYKQINQNTPTLGTPGLLRRNVATIGVDGEFDIDGKSSLALGANYEKTHYKVAGLVDSKIYGIPLTYYYAVSAKLSISAGFRYRSTDLLHAADVAGNSDAKDYFYNVGVRLKTNPKLNGYVSVGFNQRHPTVGKNESSLGLNSGVTYDYSAITRFTLDVSNDYGSASAGQSQKKFTVALGAQTQLASNWLGFGNVSFNDIKYPTTARKDEYWEATIGAKWILSQTAEITGSYIYRHNASNAAGLDFSNNVIAISAVIKY